MTAVAAGPYEHTGAYADTEFFDTTGTPPNFCAECEHAPCVAGMGRACTLRPRFGVSRRLRGEVLDLLDRVEQPNPLRRVLIDAVWAITDATDRDRNLQDQGALNDLACIRNTLQGLIS